MITLEATDEMHADCRKPNGRGDWGLPTFKTSPTDEPIKLDLCIKNWVFLSYKSRAAGR
jgi:hypothetical protein